MELRDVGMAILFGGKRSFVHVDWVSSGSLRDGERGGGEGNTRVTLGAEWATGEGVEETGSMAVCHLKGLDEGMYNV